MIWAFRGSGRARQAEGVSVGRSDKGGRQEGFSSGQSAREEFAPVDTKGGRRGGTRVVGGDWLVKGILFATFAVVSLADRAYAPLAPFIRSGLQLSQAQMGYAGGAIMAGTLLATLPLGALIDRTNTKRSLWLIVGALGLSFLALSRQRTFYGLVAGLFLVGSVRSGVIPLVNKVLALRYGAEERGSAMGAVLAGGPLGGLIGALALPFVGESQGWSAGYRLLGVTAIAIGLVCWRALPALGESSRDSSGSGTRGDHRRRLLALSLTYSVYVMTLYVVRSFLTLYLVDVVGVSPVLAGAFYALAQVAAVGGRVLWGVLADRFMATRRSWSLALNSGWTAVALVLLSLLSPESSPWAVAGLMVIWGLGVKSSWAIQSAVLADQARDGSVARSTAMLFFFMGFTGILGPVAFGSLLEATGSYFLGFRVFAGVAAASAAVFTVISLRTKALAST